VIRVDFSLLLLILLALMLGPIFFVWLTNEFRRQRRHRDAFRYVLRCTMCAFEFEDRTETVLPRCPRCGSLNERYPLSRV
jgi:predicted RNA-binding Zn-ribbon protein involved in translation (DUF1610 family)